MNRVLSLTSGNCNFESRDDFKPGRRDRRMPLVTQDKQVPVSRNRLSRDERACSVAKHTIAGQRLQVVQFMITSRQSAVLVLVMSGSAEDNEGGCDVMRLSIIRQDNESNCSTGNIHAASGARNCR